MSVALILIVFCCCLISLTTGIGVYFLNKKKEEEDSTTTNVNGNDSKAAADKAAQANKEAADKAAKAAQESADKATAKSLYDLNQKISEVDALYKKKSVSKKIYESALSTNEQKSDAKVETDILESQITPLLDEIKALKKTDIEYYGDYETGLCIGDCGRPGTRTFVRACKSKKCINNDGIPIVRTEDCNSLPCSYDSLKSVVIYDQNSSLCLSLVNDTLKFKYYDENPNQKWDYTSLGNLVILDGSKKVLDIVSDSLVLSSIDANRQTQIWQYNTGPLLNSGKIRNFETESYIYRDTSTQDAKLSKDMTLIDSVGKFRVDANGPMISVPKFENVLLDVGGGKYLTATDSTVYLQYYNMNNDNQKWILTSDGLIKSTSTGKVLDTNATSIYLHAFHGGESQRWKKDGDKYVNIATQKYINYLNNKLIPGAKNDAKVLNPVDFSKGVKAVVVNDVMINDDKTVKCLTVSSSDDSVSFEKCDTANNRQRWDFQDDYTIKNRSNNKLLDTDGVRVYTMPSNNGGYQVWALRGDRLVNEITDTYIVDNGKSIGNVTEASNTRIKYSTNPGENGVFIVNDVTGLCLDLSDGNAKFQSCNGGVFQQWNIRNNNDKIQIISKNGKYLAWQGNDKITESDTENSWKKRGSSLQTADSDLCLATKEEGSTPVDGLASLKQCGHHFRNVRITGDAPTGDGHGNIKIYNQATDMCLDLTDDNNRLQSRPCQNTPRQRWSFRPGGLLRNLASDNKCVNSNLDLVGCNLGQADHTWYRHDNNGSKELKPGPFTNNSLTIEGNGVVSIKAGDGGPLQKWDFRGNDVNGEMVSGQRFKGDWIDPSNAYDERFLQGEWQVDSNLKNADETHPDHQKWTYRKGAYGPIRNDKTGQCMASKGANDFVITQICNGTQSQQFKVDDKKQISWIESNQCLRHDYTNIKTDNCDYTGGSANQNWNKVW